MSESEILKEEVVAVTSEADTAKLKAFVGQPTIPGVTFYPYTAGRKVLLAITKNEFYQAAKHIEKHLKQTGAMLGDRPKTYADVTNDEFITLCEEAVPQFELQVAALAFICCHDDLLLADLTADPKEFRRAVVKWMNGFRTEQFADVTRESLRRYADENIGLDFEVKEPTGGATQPPN